MDLKVFSSIFLLKEPIFFDLYIILPMLFHHVWLEIPALFNILKECLFLTVQLLKSVIDTFGISLQMPLSV